MDAIEGVKKHLLRESQPNKLVYIGELLGGRNFSPKMVSIGMDENYFSDSFLTHSNRSWF